MYTNTLLIFSIVFYLATCLQAADYVPPPEIGYPAGYLSHCPGVLNNVTISPSKLKLLQIKVHQNSAQGPVWRALSLPDADKMIASDKNMDLKNKKTILYAIGFLESSSLPHSLAIASIYLKKGYNVLITETFTFLHFVYPKSARVARAIGQKLGEFLVKLSHQGMDAENLELIGMSLGSHIVAFAAKYFYAVTGKKPSRITALDPSGPCFRSLSPEYRLNSSDGEKVDIVHTNIDGLGIAEKLGHVDFYVNGGEYQPPDYLSFPCLTICSHVKSLIYWMQALEHPRKFIGVKCDSIQDARLAKCFQNNVTNVMGAETDFSMQGIFYLGTSNKYPYYRGEAGLMKENEIFTSVIKEINSDGLLSVK